MQIILTIPLILISLLSIVTAEEFEGVSQVKVPHLWQNKVSSISDYDKPVVVDFWASWCIPCRKSLPKIQSLQKEFPEIQFITVNVDEDKSQAKRFYKLLKMDILTFHDVNKKLLKALKVEAMPSFFLFNLDKKVVYSQLGYSSEDIQKIREELQKMIK